MHIFPGSLDKPLYLFVSPPLVGSTYACPPMLSWSFHPNRPAHFSLEELFPEKILCPKVEVVSLFNYITFPFHLVPSIRELQRTRGFDIDISLLLALFECKPIQYTRM
jgi:hypothetical protein